MSITSNCNCNWPIVIGNQQLQAFLLDRSFLCCSCWFFFVFHQPPKRWSCWALWMLIHNTPKLGMLSLLWPCAKNLWITSRLHHLSMTMIPWLVGSHMPLTFHMSLVERRQRYQLLLHQHSWSVSLAQQARYFAQRGPDQGHLDY